MTLSKRTILVIVSTFIALLFILAATSDVILLKSFTALERTVLAGNVQKIRSEIDETYEELFASVKDISSDVIRIGNSRLSELDLQPFFNHRLDIVACFSNSGTLLSSRSADFHKRRPAILSRNDIKQISEMGPLSAKAPNGILKGMLLVDNRPLQLVLSPVEGTDFMLLIGRYLDAEEVRRVTSLTLMDLDLFALAQEIEEAIIIASLAEGKGKD